MSAFVTLVRRCAASAIWKTREMAARALTPLVASRNLMDLIVDILKGQKPQVTFTCNAEDETCAFQCKIKSPQNMLPDANLV